MVADDMGYGDFGMFSGDRVSTPALDQLIAEGTCLSHQYTGSPVCSPSRAALLTGRYPIRTGAVTPQEVLGYDRLSVDEVTMADHFKRAGYTTGLVGKWHNGALDPRYHPNARGFDEFIGFRGGWADYYDWRLERNGSFFSSDGRYLTDVFAEEAAGFVERHASAPFFLMVAFNAPHTPLQAPSELVEKYGRAGFSPGVALTYAMVEALDGGVRRILEALDAQHLMSNTLVVFTSDNGPAFRTRPDQAPGGVALDTTRFNCGYRGAKGVVYEGGIRVPLILRWPEGLEQRSEIEDYVHFVDWLPTLCAAAGVGVEGRSPKPLDGVSVWDEIRDGKRIESPPRFWQLNQYSPLGPFTNAAMRDGRWKLVRPAIEGVTYASRLDEDLAARYVAMDIEYKYHPENVPHRIEWPEPAMTIPEPPAPQLFDLETDPLEAHNVAARFPGRVASMCLALENWFDEVESERVRRSDHEPPPVRRR